MSPGEIIALAIGVLLGIAMQRPLTCRKACCMPHKDAGLPPRHTHTGICAHPMSEPCRPEQLERLRIITERERVEMDRDAQRGPC